MATFSMVLLALLLPLITAVTAGPPPVSGITVARGPSPTIHGMQIYFGDLHSHSGYSDGQGTPADAYATAKASGIDFFALTDHGFMLTAPEWQETLNQANAATVDGQFVALRGFEYSHAQGDLIVLGTNTYISRNDPRYDTLAEFYDWIAGQPPAIGQFTQARPGFNFNNFAYHPAADRKITLRELSTAEQFFLSLNAGWHLSVSYNSDTHTTNWGCCPHMGAIAPELTQPAILDALRAGRTFFVSPHDRNLAVMMQANGHWMGATVPRTTTLNFIINAHDPDPTGGNLNLVLHDNGLPVASAWLQSSLIYTWTPTIPATPGHYYYVTAYYDGWLAPPAYSSPIWVE